MDKSKKAIGYKASSLPPKSSSSTRVPAVEVKEGLKQRISDLAVYFLGPPNLSLSDARELRFGNNGSISVALSGGKAGCWYDHEGGNGGAGLELICHYLVLEELEALDWARKWLGESSDVGKVVEKLGSRKRSATLQTSSSDDLGEKVANILREAVSPISTPVIPYLHSRGITAPLPDCIRYQPRAFGQHGAMVALVTDEGGAVLAVQRVYLTSEGQKAPLHPSKRTNKAVDDWAERGAVRLPGRQPLVLCEGVETGLSIWQATGQEVWVCCGVSNIAKAPVPQGAIMIIARDGDKPGSSADTQVLSAAQSFAARGLTVSVASPSEGQDFNDVLRSKGEQAVRDMLEAAAPTNASVCDWRLDLLTNRDGRPLPVLANAIHALRTAFAWKGVLWFNEFATEVVARQAPPWRAGDPSWQESPWSNRDDLLVTNWLQREGIMVPLAVAGQAIEAVANDRPYHPVRDYLEQLKWDGTPRIDLWLHRYLGADDSPFALAIGPRWLISAVARIYLPGAKADCALILEGQQGSKKSSALKILGNPWFADRLSDLSSKDAAMETRGVWIFEIAELDTMSRAEVGTIKAYISRTSDRFRPPYAKRVVDLPRQCIFAGTVNPEGGYLKDPTGGRRFWPVACGTIDITALERDRDHLWAEARVRFLNGDPWWLENAELEALATEQQADRYQGDPWDEIIHNYLERVAINRNDVSVGEILKEALLLDQSRWTQADQNRVARILVNMRFKKYRARLGGHSDGSHRERRYRRNV